MDQNNEFMSHNNNDKLYLKTICGDSTGYSFGNKVSFSSLSQKNTQHSIILVVSKLELDVYNIFHLPDFQNYVVLWFGYIAFL